MASRLRSCQRWRKVRRPASLRKTAPLVLHREGQPQPLLTPEGNALRGKMEFHHVTLAGQAQAVGHDRQTPEEQSVAPPLPGGLVMGPPVEQVPLHRA